MLGHSNRLQRQYRAYCFHMHMLFCLREHAYKEKNNGLEKSMTLEIKNTHGKSLNGLQWDSGIIGTLKCHQDTGSISLFGESPERSRVCKLLGFFDKECLNPVIRSTFPLARRCRVFYWVCISMLNFLLGKEKYNSAHHP